MIVNQEIIHVITYYVDRVSRENIQGSNVFIYIGWGCCQIYIKSKLQNMKYNSIRPTNDDYILRLWKVGLQSKFWFLVLLYKYN